MEFSGLAYDSLNDYKWQNRPDMERFNLTKMAICNFMLTNVNCCPSITSKAFLLLSETARKI